MDIPNAESEKASRGSREAFTEDLETNLELITKRIRDENLKKEEFILGTRTQTKTYLLYVEDLAYDGIVKEVQIRLRNLNRDEVMDSGVAEQLTKENPQSPFPQSQATERPDRVSQELLNGRVALLFEHSPEALLLPAVLSNFFQTSDDYYRHFWIVSFLRVIRMAAAWMAVLLPGFFVAVTGFHTEVLPTNLILVMAQSREGVPFPVILEILILELAFELIREAGVRMPGTVGSTIGIVGGLIIGQSAVSANLVSPMSVVMVGLSALGAFTVPDEEMSEALRLVKYLILFLSGFLGIFGLVLGTYLMIVHLAGLKSYGIPYLYPFVAADMNFDNDLRDGVIRFPMYDLWSRPIFTKRSQRVRMKHHEKKHREKEHRKKEHHVFK